MIINGVTGHELVVHPGLLLYVGVQRQLDRASRVLSLRSYSRTRASEGPKGTRGALVL